MSCTDPKCETCGSNDSPLYLHGRCHPSAPTWAVLTENILTIECAECSKFIAQFQVVQVGSDVN